MTQPLQTGAFPVTGCLIKAAPLLRQDRSHGRPGEADGEGRQLLRARLGHPRDPRGVAPRLPRPRVGLSQRPPPPQGEVSALTAVPQRGAPERGPCASLGRGHPFIHSFTNSFLQSVSVCGRPAPRDHGSRTLGSNRIQLCGSLAVSSRASSVTDPCLGFLIQNLGASALLRSG